ncbi:MAG: cyclic pyranopterin monophosphate synthase MoaC [Elusimicrobia bacterium HGW-Elusimicrobia-4]|nr:MAG: cyclic pyranopterin monophosphate synthase MoaC [Elusimicrobia bacterium HGW-Elusimicrobia-4]
MKSFSHFDKKGKARMVDVSQKAATLRYAKAEATVKMSSETVEKIKKSEIKKGDVLTAAKLAAIMSAKSTSNLIPLTHPIKITHSDVKFSLSAKNGIKIISEVKVFDTTGCEMEALTMAAVAGLTIYDMIKAVDRSAEITDVRLLKKCGGKSGVWKR